MWKWFGILMWFAGAAACSTSSEPVDASGNSETLSLDRDANGNLRYCKADDPTNCVTVSNPSNCATLEITVNTRTGETCERCLSSAGAVTYERCQGTSIACALVTAPEPDCVVCAHIDGPVIYSTCIPSEPEHCEYYPVAGATGLRECEVCYGHDGSVASDTCGPDCSNVACAQVACADGYTALTPPDQCCPICVPIDVCTFNENGESRVCPDVDFPECPPGFNLERDPFDCCSFQCIPTTCDAVACPAVFEECPPGFEWDYSYPNCCGICVPAGEPNRCQSNADCEPNQKCTEPTVCEQSCNSAGADPDMSPPDLPTTCEVECYGFCRPDNVICPPLPAAPFYECDGKWIDPGYGPNGCPLPPVCACPVGSQSWDGRCLDLCELVGCVEPPDNGECERGEKFVTDYPYCCGACVPTERALCDESGGEWEFGCGHTNCNVQVDCFTPELGCNCGAYRSWVEGKGCVPDASCRDGNPCDVAGGRFDDGSGFPSEDGCNQCFCIDGDVVCTDAACPECWRAWRDEDGACRSPNDGEYPEHCCADSVVCEQTGGRWDETSCGDYQCGQFPVCDAIVPGCDCGEAANFVSGSGCIQDRECRDSSSCTTDDGAEYGEGDVWPRGDGCNHCTCYEGGVYCTENACAP